MVLEQLDIHRQKDEHFQTLTLHHTKKLLEIAQRAKFKSWNYKNLGKKKGEKPSRPWIRQRFLITPKTQLTK